MQLRPDGSAIENRSNCGIGKYGGCNIGPVYVRTDGPVFTAEKIARLPQEF